MPGFPNFFNSQVRKKKKLEKQREQKLNDIDSLEREAKKALDRENNFVHVLTQQLLRVYDSARELVPDAKDSTWVDNIKQYIDDAVKVAKYASIAGGMGALAGYLAGRSDLSGKLAIGVSVPAVLCVLWKVNNEEQARSRARKFLALVEDIKDSRKNIEKRMGDIAVSLAFRFEYAVQKLPADEDGVEELASFFSTAIARDILAESKKILELKMTSAEIVQLATTVAVPQSREDSIYSDWIQNKQLKNVDNNNWTVPGLLLRSPIYVVSLDKYYVRDSELGKNNRADKYPPQKVYSQLVRYVEADDESIVAIKAMRNLPVEEKLIVLRNEYKTILEQENNYVQQSQVSEDSASDKEVEVVEENNQLSEAISSIAEHLLGVELNNDHQENLYDLYKQGKNSSLKFSLKFY